MLLFVGIEWSFLFKISKIDAHTQRKDYSSSNYFHLSVITINMNKGERKFHKLQK
jgi:hypothetical protein